MRIIYSSVVFLLFTWQIASGQTLTSSNLPIVVITTDGSVSIPDEPGVLGNMKIIYRGPGQRNYLTDQNNSAYLIYNGRIDIEKRGSSSQSSPKRNYGLTTLLPDNVTNNNVSLLGMPAENDWILGGMVFDTSMVRDYLCDNLSRQIGEYASRTSYCEVMVNGDYKGLYILQEKIKADDGRVDVKKIQPGDIALPDLSGGYITKADKTTGGDPVAWTMDGWWGATVDYIHVLPKPENVMVQQNDYIKSVFYNFESLVLANNTSPADGFPSVIDIPSFIDYMLINELAANPDAYQYSTYFHKDKNGKLRAGPIWDMDLTFGNDLFMWGFDRSKTDLWYFYDINWNNGSKFWYGLFTNNIFRCYMSKRWNELIQPGEPLNPASISDFLDLTVDSISEAAARDYTRWNKLGSLTDRVNKIKTFVSQRETWITQNIGSYYSCDNVPTPGLVITKVMYHPVGTVLYPDEDDLEFIEIKNTTNLTVNLTGVYFMGTGFVYQFPVNSLLGGKSFVIIASDDDAFEATYGFKPFGKFTRQLSDDDQDIILADAFGNIIDRVHYYDSYPWPDADGNGYYLKLKDISLDNSLAENWIATREALLSPGSGKDDPWILIYPNPASEYVRIRTVSDIKTLRLYDSGGNLVIIENPGCDEYDLDISHLAGGMYFLKVETSDRTRTQKIVKQ